MHTLHPHPHPSISSFLSLYMFEEEKKKMRKDTAWRQDRACHDILYWSVSLTLQWQAKKQNKEGPDPEGWAVWHSG